MKIGTKAMLTLLVITMLALSSTTAMALGPEGNYANRGRKLEKLQRHHDRKLELRASILGMSANQLRDELHKKSFSQILKEKGFKDIDAFHKALEGKLRIELKKRGLTEAKINRFLEKRQQKVERYIDAHH